MLTAFLTPAGWDRLCSLLEPKASCGVTMDVGPEPRLDNLWLLSTGIYYAFQEGEIHLEPRADGDPFTPSHPLGCLSPPLSTPASLEAAGLHQSVSVTTPAQI